MFVAITGIGYRSPPRTAVNVAMTFSCVTFWMGPIVVLNGYLLPFAASRSFYHKGDMMHTKCPLPRWYFSIAAARAEATGHKVEIGIMRLACLRPDHNSSVDSREDLCPSSDSSSRV